MLVRHNPSLYAAIIALLIVSGCNKSGDNPQAASTPPPMPVPIMVADPKPVPTTTEYLSTLKSRNYTTISPQVDGQITKIFVKSGDRVNDGTPLMQIDPLKQEATANSQEATRAAREAALKLATEQLNRAKRLAAEGVVSKQELDQAQAAYDSAQAEVKALEAQVREQQVQLRYYRITAPTSGIIGDVPVHVGDRVENSTVLTSISQPGALEAYIEVPVERAKDLAIGKKVELVDTSRDIVGTSHITFISPQVSPNSQTILVKAQVDNNNGLFRTDQLVRARIVWEAKPTILVPVLAVSRISGQNFIFVAEQTDKGLVAKQRQVTLGDLQGNDYLVLDGLKAGDKIITGSTQMLGEGTPVQPKQ
jgi:RND family efflux transporter MFP subunit